MKKILNYGVAYIHNGQPIDNQYFSKVAMVKQYLDILFRLDRNYEVSDLKCYVWEGIKNPQYKDITSDVNKFLNR